MKDWQHDRHHYPPYFTGDMLVESLGNGLAQAHSLALTEVKPNWPSSTGLSQRATQGWQNSCNDLKINDYK